MPQMYRMGIISVDLATHLALSVVDLPILVPSVMPVVPLISYTTGVVFPRAQ